MPSKPVRQASTSHPVILRCCTYSVLLVLECCAARPTFSAISKSQSPEEVYGILSRVLFAWINPILYRGYKKILISQDLPHLGQKMRSELTRKMMLQAWSQRKSAKPENNKSLPLALLRCLKDPFFAAIIPRLFLIVFRYSQPRLIEKSIAHVVAYPAGTEEQRGFWLIVSAVAIYIGLALSTAVYDHRINRLELMTRSALVGLIHDKTMKSPSIAYDNGEATTLMSTDADSLGGIAEMVHETWAQVVEVLIGIGLLATQVGWIWPIPLILIYLCSHTSRFVAKRLQPRQRAWNAATQNRVAATSSVLSEMKVVKMLGFQYCLTRRIQELRKKELWAASNLRWIMVFYNASANALGIFSPAVTLVIYAVLSAARGSSLDAETAFTTMAILGMVTHPANMIMTIVPRVVAAFAGFERIQAFLLRPSLKGSRGTLPNNTQDKLSWNPGSGQLNKHNLAVKIDHLTIGHKRPLLEDINIDVIAGSLTIISGPTGSGKSTLLRAILGEVVPSQGLISLSTQQIAYCAQKPWLCSGSIKEAIYGATDTHRTIGDDFERRYQDVLGACCLNHDLDCLPNGDQTQIGSRGLNLSGGQRQRLTLARALFAGCDMILLDDTFSGLDGETEKAVFDNLFGATAILVSNSSQYFQAAQHIVVLEEHRVADQGTWQNLKNKAASIAKFSTGHRSIDNTVLTASFNRLSAQLRAKDDTEMESGDPALYGYYLKSIDVVNIALLLLNTGLYAFFITIPQYWLRLWTEVGSRNTAFYVSGFLFLSTMSWMSTSIQMWSVIIRLAPQSGSRLHQRLLYTITSAPLSYFSATDNGSILNRFSQDIQLIDRELPSSLQSTVTQIFKLLMQTAILCVTQKWLALTVPVCMIVVYVVQKLYLRTSRQLRFLELEARAGVFSSFLESVEGLETIRSFGWSRAVIEDNIMSVNNSQRPEYLLLSLKRWLNLVFDLVAAAIATSAVAIAVTLPGHVSGAQVGIALNIMLVANTTLLRLVSNWARLETSLGAIARLKTLESMTPSEDGQAWNMDPPENWPTAGRIEFQNITASYRAGSIAIRNLSLNVNAGQKLIVCGRTGSGKSSLLLTLLRLLELQSGKIELDGINIKKVRLDLLRQWCFITMSQDPLLLPNETLRFNLDPDAAASDDILLAALAKVGLLLHFEDGTRFGGEAATAIDTLGFGEHSILDKKLSMFQELSVGQCQLLALCRALVKVNSSRLLGLKPVVILDEATSSLDNATETTIYRIIDDEFTDRGHTVVIVGHRLDALQEHTRSGRDIVAFMVDGRLQEVIENANSAKFDRFRQMKKKSVD
ncbi:putative ABC transporter [Polychaeton citri CBS 116435]|uniref:ABC transporter n=1 Tax=Polychaeton citri CBS 116435 TaxID=1314669 RepID=A0A9P4QAI2_9PEZI|nr:putative ABC transporter [Polychaeton citri CBS 116435]